MPLFDTSQYNLCIKLVARKVGLLVAFVCFVFFPSGAPPLFWALLGVRAFEQGCSAEMRASEEPVGGRASLEQGKEKTPGLVLNFCSASASPPPLRVFFHRVFAARGSQNFVFLFPLFFCVFPTSCVCRPFPRAVGTGSDLCSSTSRRTQLSCSKDNHVSACAYNVNHRIQWIALLLLPCVPRVDEAASASAFGLLELQQHLLSGVP